MPEILFHLENFPVVLLSIESSTHHPNGKWHFLFWQQHTHTYNSICSIDRTWTWTWALKHGVYQPNGRLIALNSPYTHVSYTIIIVRINEQHTISKWNLKQLFFGFARFLSCWKITCNKMINFTLHMVLLLKTPQIVMDSCLYRKKNCKR